MVTASAASITASCLTLQKRAIFLLISGDNDSSVLQTIISGPPRRRRPLRDLARSGAPPRGVARVGWRSRPRGRRGLRVDPRGARSIRLHERAHPPRPTRAPTGAIRGLVRGAPARAGLSGHAGRRTVRPGRRPHRRTRARAACRPVQALVRHAPGRRAARPGALRSDAQRAREWRGGDHHRRLQRAHAHAGQGNADPSLGRRSADGAGAPASRRTAESKDKDRPSRALAAQFLADG